MKFLIALFLLSSPAFAADLACHVQAEEQGLNDNYDLDLSGNGYRVTHNGHSRNTYSAAYTLDRHFPTRNGWEGVLVKTQDDSTWKDMPALLTLKYAVTGGFQDGPVYILEGLGEKSVWFGRSSCTAGKTFASDCPEGTKPGHCPSRNCGSCL